MEHRIPLAVLAVWHLRHKRAVGWWFEGPGGVVAAGYHNTRKQAWDAFRDAYWYGRLPVIKKG
jgi:hypothetical protein